MGATNYVADINFISCGMTVYQMFMYYDMLITVNPYPANVENNASRWQMGFNSAFIGLRNIDDEVYFRLH